MRVAGTQLIQGYMNSSRHQPPSSFSSGRFLALLAIQLIAMTLLLGITWQIFEVHERFAAERARVSQCRATVEQLEDIFAGISEASVRRDTEREQFARVGDVLAAHGWLAELLQKTGSDLPEQTEDVRIAAKALSNALPTNPKRAGARERNDVAAAAHRLRQAMAALERGLDSVDDADYRNYQAIHASRMWALALIGLGWLMTVIAIVDAMQVFRRLRKEELARFSVEAELRAERSALEQRVQARTAALEAEVRERQRAERLNRGRNRTLELLAQNESASVTLRALADTVAEFRSTWICVIHSVDGSMLKLAAGAGLNDKLSQHFRCISTEFAGAPESVSLASGRPHSILDLGLERKPWSELLRANGLVSVWSAPFFAPKGGALGTLTVYARLKWEPDPSDLEMLEMACHMAALVLERSRLNAQLIDHAYHDSLTSLPNRRLGRDRLSNAMSRAARAGSRLAVLWIDLDRFKQVNDQYGHPVGDAVLQHATQRFTGRLRSSDTLARMGGDEFMAVLENVGSMDEACTVANSLLEVLVPPMQIGEVEVSVAASIGVSFYPQDGTTVDSLAQHADQAMYAAKFGGYGVMTFSPDMDREPAERRELELELKAALDAGGFSIAYQPVCFPDGGLHGFEALLRFESPRLGNVPPSHFIPVAEDAQLIVPIGEWVLREVCRQSCAWRDAGYPTAPISVNISAEQFVRDDFADRVAEILRDAGVAGDNLILELTESTVMRDFAESARQMKHLKRLGIRIAIDDFGTGYSSLSYLHRLPINGLKIDRSFVETLNQPEGTLPIVEAVLSMAHTLGLRVVAEGVETKEQLGTLREKGCDLIQGFYFSRPVEPHAAAEFLVVGKVDPAGQILAAEERELVLRELAQDASAG